LGHPNEFQTTDNPFSSGRLELKRRPVSFDLYILEKVAPTPALATSGSWSVAAWLSSLGHRISWDAVRFGVQTGCAGLLALTISLYLATPSPGWSVLTAMILVLAKYLGGIAEKSAFRFLGTVVGAVIGTLLSGNLMSNPVLLLGGTFVVVGYCTYKFGGTKVPYAYFLCALTTLVVVSDSLNDPDHSWKIALDRTIQVGVGIFSTMVVTSVIFPRYARHDFQARLRQALGEADALVEELQRRDAGSPIDSVKVDRITSSYASKLEGLRAILHFGTRESAFFASREAIFRAMTTDVSALLASLTTLLDRPAHAGMAAFFEKETTAISTALRQEIQELIKRKMGSREAPDSSLKDCLAALDARLHLFRNGGYWKPFPLAEVVEYYEFLFSLREAAAALEAIREKLDSLPVEGSAEYFKVKKPPPQSPLLKRYWRHCGIKAGLAACLGLVLAYWLQPPGMTAIALWGWLFVILAKNYPGGQGDRGAFQLAFWTAVAGIPMMAFLILIMPTLSNPVVMGLFVFCSLFAYGYLSLPISGITFLMQAAILIMSGLIALNPQEPVTFQALVGLYVGTIFGIFLAAVVQRLLWPVLPQGEIRQATADFFQRAGELLRTVREATEQERERFRLIPSEVTPWARVMTTPEVPKGEDQRLLDCVTRMRRFGHHMVELPPLPAEGSVIDRIPRTREVLLALRGQMSELADRLGEVFSKGDTRRLKPPPPVNLEPMNALLASARDDGSIHALSESEVVEYLGSVSRYLRTAHSLDELKDSIAKLSLSRYAGDYAL